MRTYIFLILTLKNVVPETHVSICRESTSLCFPDGRMRTVLMVAEKPSLAQSIAHILSHRKCSSRKGSNGACSVHEWTDSFPPTGEKVKYKMTSVCGHVMSLDFLAKFNSWDK